MRSSTASRPWHDQIAIFVERSLEYGAGTGSLQMSANGLTKYLATNRDFDTCVGLATQQFSLESRLIVVRVLSVNHRRLAPKRARRISEIIAYTLVRVGEGRWPSLHEMCYRTFKCGRRGTFETRPRGRWREYHLIRARAQARGPLRCCPPALRTAVGGVGNASSAFSKPRWARLWRPRRRHRPRPQSSLRLARCRSR